MFNRFWLLFAQAVTILLAAWFIAITLKPFVDLSDISKTFRIGVRRQGLDKLTRDGMLTDGRRVIRMATSATPLAPVLAPVKNLTG